MKNLLITLLSLCATSTLFAQSGLEIMQKNEAQMSSKFQTVNLTMKLTSAKGRVKERTLEWQSSEMPQGTEKSLIRFTYPADIKGSGLLSIDENNVETMWLYLPALKKSRQISSKEKSGSFMGSDFSYSDISSEDLKDYTYKVVGSESIFGHDCYKIEATPISEETIKETGYATRILWVRKKDHMITQVNYFNKEGEHIKQLIANDIKDAGNNKLRAYTMSMKNLVKGSSTVLSFSDYNINTPIENEVFTQRNLSSW